MSNLASNYEQVINEKLIPYFLQSAQALTGKIQTPANPVDLTGKTRADARIEFSNDEAGSKYYQALSQGGTVADKMAAKLQSDVLSVLRREAQQSARTRVQMTMDEANRSARLGSPSGPLNRCLLGAPQNILNLGATNNNATV